MLNAIDKNDYLSRLQNILTQTKASLSQSASSTDNASMLVKKESIRMDSLSISTFKENKPEEYKYNLTEDGYLPDFQLGDWSKTKNALFKENVMQINNVNVSVFLPQGLQNEIALNPELKNIIDGKINSFVANNSKESIGIDSEAAFSVYSQHMALSFDENGEIMHTYIRRETINVYSGGALSAGNTLGGLSYQNMQGFLSYQKTVIGFAANMPILASNNVAEGDISSSSGVQATPKNIAVNESAIAIFEVAQVRGSDAVIEVRKANGDIINLETGDIISKAAPII